MNNPTIEIKDGKIVISLPIDTLNNLKISERNQVGNEIGYRVDQILKWISEKEPKINRKFTEDEYIDLVYWIFGTHPAKIKISGVD